MHWRPSDHHQDVGPLCLRSPASAISLENRREHGGGKRKVRGGHWTGRGKGLWVGARSA